MNYTGIFLNDSHMTWNFGFPLVYPEGVKPGDPAEIKILGRYDDEDVSCWICEFNDHYTQPKGTLLHITIETRNGAKPVMSGLRATQNPDNIVQCIPFKVQGQWK